MMMEHSLLSGAGARGGAQMAAPPNGLQLILSSASSSHLANTSSGSGARQAKQSSDTLVMQNLGYYQLQAHRPGLWTLRLAPGRATALFTLDGATPLSDTTSSSSTTTNTPTHPQEEGDNDDDDHRGVEEVGSSSSRDSGVFIPVRSFANEVRLVSFVASP